MEPILKIVPRTQIVTIMESHADRTEYLTTAFAEAGYIFNPLLVVEVVDGVYLMTDDGSYLEALERLRVDFVPVQVVPVPDPPIMTGHIFLSQWNNDQFNEFQRIFPRDTHIAVGDSANLENRIYARIKSWDGNELGAGIDLGKSHHASAILTDFVNFLRQRANIVKPTDRKSAVTGGKPDSGTVQMEIGNIGFDEVLRLSQNGFLLPAGFYRPECLCRVLGINYPIKVLRENASVTDKQTFLHDLIALRMESGRAESFNGRVLLLNY